MPQGLLITLEGGEGCGKTTQQALLSQRLTRLGIPHVVTREPGGTALGERLRQLLLASDLQPWTELLLFAADRAEHVHRVINPALGAGKVVLCDRFVDSTLAYQGYGRGLPLDQLQQLNHLATQGVRPHLTLWLDVPPHVGLSRALQRQGKLDSIETQDLGFHQRLYHGFQTLAEGDPKRWRRIDGVPGIEQVAEQIWRVVAPWLGPFSPQPHLS
ncbi:MAG: dTMP kinase [Thermostichales cyanobacterium BF4_bins_65]